MDRRLAHRLLIMSFLIFAVIGTGQAAPRVLVEPAEVQFEFATKPLYPLAPVEVRFGLQDEGAEKPESAVRAKVSLTVTDLVHTRDRTKVISKHYIQARTSYDDQWYSFDRELQLHLEDSVQLRMLPSAWGWAGTYEGALQSKDQTIYVPISLVIHPYSEIAMVEPARVTINADQGPGTYWVDDDEIVTISVVANQPWTLTLSSGGFHYQDEWGGNDTPIIKPEQLLCEIVNPTLLRNGSVVSLENGRTLGTSNSSTEILVRIGCTTTWGDPAGTYQGDLFLDLSSPNNTF